MKISVGKDIRRRIITNLLSAHKQIADYGSAESLIMLTKFISKFSRQFDDDFFEDEKAEEKKSEKKEERAEEKAE